MEPKDPKIKTIEENKDWEEVKDSNQIASNNSNPSVTYGDK